MHLSKTAIKLMYHCKIVKLNNLYLNKTYQKYYKKKLDQCAKIKNGLF